MGKLPRAIKCKTRGCRRRAKGYCHTCKSRKYRKENPMRYAYNNLRSNCYRRHGRAWFYLTFEEFTQFAIETDYITGKGKTKMSYSIDKIDPTMGYFIGNIRIMTLSGNSKKHTKILKYEYDPNERRMIATVTDKDHSISHGPF